MLKWFFFEVELDLKGDVILLFFMENEMNVEKFFGGMNVLLYVKDVFYEVIVYGCGE